MIKVRKKEKSSIIWLREEKKSEYLVEEIARKRAHWEGIVGAFAVGFGYIEAIYKAFDDLRELIIKLIILFQTLKKNRRQNLATLVKN